MNNLGVILTIEYLDIIITTKIEDAPTAKVPTIPATILDSESDYDSISISFYSH